MPYATWQQVASFDFTAQSNLDIFAGGSGTYAIGGLSWSARNIPNSTEFQIINGTGLRITQPAGISRTITNAANTGPQIGVTLGQLYPDFDPTLDYCLQAVVNYIDPPDVTGPTTLCGLLGLSGVPAGSGANQRWVGVGRGNTDLFGRIDQGGNATGNVDTNAANNCMGIVFRGNGESIALSAQVTAGFANPSSMQFCAMRTTEFTTTGQAFLQPEVDFLLTTVTRTATGTSFQVVIPRIALWAR